jgi:DNA-binding NarL/FixJ family response regulator
MGWLALHDSGFGTNLSRPNLDPQSLFMKILVVDDHPLIREGLVNVLRELDHDLSIMEAQTPQDALAALEREADISLVLLDLQFEDRFDGMDLLRQARANWPEVPIVVLSGVDSPQIVRQAIDEGAMGFITKRSPTPVLVSALRLVLAGAVYIPPQALAADLPTIHAHPPPDESGSEVGPTLAALGLTERQTEVLAHLVQGKPNKVICRELGLAEGTVKTHIAAILRALNVTSRTQALFALSRLGVQLPFPLRSPAPPHEHGL